MLQIRQGVFETNSSSTHAISIAKWDDTMRVPDSIHFCLNKEFGWEFEKYNDVMSKASYLWIAACSIYGNISNEDNLIEIKEKIFNILFDAGVKNITFDSGDYIEYDWNNEGALLSFNGYIDHVYSLNNWVDELIDDPNLLLAYLFNPDSQVYTGNDNDDRTPEYNGNAIYTRYKSN